MLWHGAKTCRTFTIGEAFRSQFRKLLEETDHGEGYGDLWWLRLTSVDVLPTFFREKSVIQALHSNWWPTSTCFHSDQGFRWNFPR